MEGITIRPEELRSSSSEMKTKINAMRDALQKASSIMNSTSVAFVASSADAMREKYNSLKAKFDMFYEEMASYAEFLEKTAASYEKADDEITKKANDILQA